MDKTVLITGAAGGLGMALAEEFLEHGWQVVATDLDVKPLESLAGQPRCIVLPMDVTSDQSVARVAEKVHDRDITIDLIINNAGIDRYFPLSITPAEAFRQVFEVNVFGGYRVNQVFLPLVRRPGGRIIHISSESLRLTLPFMPYPMSKQLVESYAKALRIELRFLDIDVVIVRPGAIRTDLLNQVKNLPAVPGESPLDKAFSAFAASASREIGKTIEPRKAAGFIRKVAGIPHPAAVYKINNMLKLKIAAWIPFSWLEKVIYRKLS